VETIARDDSAGESRRMASSFAPGRLPPDPADHPGRRAPRDKRQAQEDEVGASCVGETLEEHDGDALHGDVFGTRRSPAG